ncbi:MAG: hypothetical protein ACFCUG_15985 [Thiotrichales bacterium]
MTTACNLGLDPDGAYVTASRDRLHLHINLILAASGQPTAEVPDTAGVMDTVDDLLNAYREKGRLLAAHLCPSDQRIQQFLQRYLSELELDRVPELPGQTFILDRYGIARELSLPLGEDVFRSEIIESYRVAQGVLHNPAKDRRTTHGSFHVAEGGLPIPGDKRAMPKRAFARMLEHALKPPEDLQVIPFTANQRQPARMFVSLLLRPSVCPEIPGLDAEKSMEIRFFAPGNLVSNLDFVESIFGNAGNPQLVENDAALDIDHWTGHTGCVILAPHLTRLTKRELGLPHRDHATQRQLRDGMCWTREDELYNGGEAFKLTARDDSGVIVTLLADNYFGYCKKEVKTQISYAANLFGLAEEEHAGGALAFERRNHGEEYGIDDITRPPGYSFAEVVETYGDVMDVQPQGYGIDQRFPEVIYVPQALRMDLNAQTITWDRDGTTETLRLRPGHIYIQPNGYKIEMCKHPGAPSWRLIGTVAEGTFCHKPSTVSGGGKSEISKSLEDAVIYGPLFVDDLAHDLDRVQEIFDRDYTTRFKPGGEHEDNDLRRGPLSPNRSLGSFIKLLTPSPGYTDEFNAWLKSIPPRIQALAFLIKRFYRPEWGNDWRRYLSVDEVDGHPAHELKLHGRRIVASYLRVGFDEQKKWRTFKVRQDFIAAEKVQMEDDISVSVVVPQTQIAHCSPRQTEAHSVKLVKNCEYRLFQRPDDAVIPGYDKQAESDLARAGNFIANFEPLKGAPLDQVVDDVLTLCNLTDPMRTLLIAAQTRGDQHVVSSAHPRLVDGKPTKNPRYLQTRPDLVHPVRKYVAEMGARLHRKLALNAPICHPVDAVLSGRRNNPPEPGIRPLAVYNPIHYQELPELFMDYICSLTGKSPSTTGAGSEGALTKGPFNALRPTADLNNTLVSFILTGYAGYSTPAGHIGPAVRVDHDISLLIPEIWSRLKHNERDPSYLIAHGYLERVADFHHAGERVLASRLGYRITDRFVRAFMGKIFDNPRAVFTQPILKPELQDKAAFVDGVHNIVESQRQVAQRYLDDGTIEDACPPLRALLFIMAEGHFHGQDVHAPAIRQLFTRDYLLACDWYQERLEVKQQRDIALWKRHVHSLEDFLRLRHYASVAETLRARESLDVARARLTAAQSPAYRASLVGTIGADPLRPPREAMLREEMARWRAFKDSESAPARDALSA